MGFDNGKVTFRIDHTPLHRIAVQFEWAEPFGELQKNQKIGHFSGHVSFRRKKAPAGIVPSSTGLVKSTAAGRRPPAAAVLAAVGTPNTRV